jgi:ferrochelatase
LTEEQAAALQQELQRRGKEIQVFVGMCTWRPFLDEAMDKIAASGTQKLVVLPLFPQYSVTTTGAGFSLLHKIIDRRPPLKKLEIQWIRAWHDQPTYIEAFRRAIQTELAAFTAPDKVHIVFSAHSIPESYVKNGDPYLDQTRQSVELIMDALGRKNTYELAFQSKIGPVKWLSPSTNSVLMELGRKGVQNVLIVPISFVSEHIETLYELDILYKHIAQDAGIANFRRVPAANSDPTFIRALAEIVEGALK